MKTIDQNGGITRRGFFERSAKTLAGAQVLAVVNSANAANPGLLERANSNSTPLAGKIALEEHFVIPETLNASYGAAGSPEFQFQLEDIADRRIAEMDRGGIAICILSLVGPGIQAIPSVP